MPGADLYVLLTESLSPAMSTVRITHAAGSAPKLAICTARTATATSWPWLLRMLHAFAWTWPIKAHIHYRVHLHHACIDEVQRWLHFILHCWRMSATCNCQIALEATKLTT